MNSRNPKEELRRGWTTGAYAAATTAAAFKAIVVGKFSPSIKITLPKGQTPEFHLSRTEKGLNWARAGAIKDAGDDPDITHGAEVISEVRLGKLNTGIVFKAGEGIGTVTLPGLSLAIGEPAINPKPREIISEAVLKIAGELGVPSDIIITLSIPGGEQLAKKTMNGRLGIRGGLSILGTTGIVIPYSCASWINSIHRGIDVARAANLNHIAAATGSTSEAAVQRMFNFPEQALIDMGDFVGGMLKYLRKKPIPHLTLAGGFGKLAKLAQGNLDLHSSRSSLDMGKLAKIISDIGGASTLVRATKLSNTGQEALEYCQQAGIPIGDFIAKGAREVTLATLAGDTRVKVLIFNREGVLVGKSN